MRSNPEILVLVTRFLNNPDDIELIKEVEEYRQQSPENESFFLEIKKIWELSPKTALLNEVDVKSSTDKLKRSLKQPSSNTNFIWLKGIAASIVFLSIGYFLYVQSTKTVFSILKTTSHQIDSVKLVDGSVIILAENSEMTYPDQFGSIREISLTKGQAFFKIAKDPKHPFKVLMKKSNVIVLGTSFNIKMTETNIDLGVITGRVIFTPYENGTTSILTAGQALSYDIVKKEFLTKIAQNSDSWLTKELVFVDTPLEEVCKQLSDYYEADIKLKNNNHTAKKLNAIFKYQSLDQVLEILNETYNIKIKKENNQINLITP